MATRSGGVPGVHRARWVRQRRSDARGLRRWIRWKLGERIAEEYMLPYNRKIWSVDLDSLGTYWLYKLSDVSFRKTFAAVWSDALRAPSRRTADSCTPGATATARSGRGWVTRSVSASSPAIR